MQKNIKEIESCIPVNDDRLSIFDDSNEPILNTINNILKSNANKENITSDILKALEGYYTGPSVSEQIRQMRIAFENIIELPFHCNNNVLYDFDNELLEELSYCLKSSKKGGKGYFENFKQFERFLGVSQGSLHQVLFDKTYNFKKVNTKSYYKLIRFLSNYKNVEELNNDLLIASEQWNKKKSKEPLADSRKQPII
ncbi:hypothetical protein [uncultured Arcobacter sp.]|uniref:hypothetical protein n=1 Tax=uncultured Arcobacter sp. TaxID=165434 RepID=UPI002631074C|nr:hypothetical protein [uncultured Arcobacter sp.]